MISFVILHYKNFKDTIACINSLKKLDNQSQISIIVVDNNSLKEEEKKVIKRYTENLILLEKNFGVAKAYNAGAKYAIEKFHPEFICAMNNDIIIDQEDIVKRISNTYLKYKFDMLGPRIICDGDSVNPFPAYDTLEKINDTIKKNNRLIGIYQNKLKGYLAEIYLSIKHTIKKPKKKYNGKTEEINVALHCCFIVFSKKYYKRFVNIMNDATFLFHEEEFLYFRAQQNKLVSIYSPSIEIIHKEGQTMKLKDKNVIKRKLFKLKECNKSLEILKNKLENKDTI